ncbi:hypothetical protein Bca4012_057142 [Brassica carinata]
MSFETHALASHSWDTENLIPFVFDSSQLFSMSLAKKKTTVFQEEGDLVVVQSFKGAHGSVCVTVSCIAPMSLNAYTTLKLGLMVKIILKVREQAELKDDFMFFPDYMLSGDHLKMQICIGSEYKYAVAAPAAIEATNPLNEGPRELSDEFNTKLNLENQNEESDEKMHVEADGSSSSDDSNDEEEEEPIVNPQPPRPTTTGGSRTLFVANLAFNVKKSDIKEFFQEAGEVVDVKFAMGPDDCSFRGFGHILFASPEEAQNVRALGFHRRTLLGREICLDMVPESSQIRSFGGNLSGGGDGRINQEYLKIKTKGGLLTYQSFRSD